MKTPTIRKEVVVKTYQCMQWTGDNFQELNQWMNSITYNLTQYDDHVVFEYTGNLVPKNDWFVYSEHDGEVEIYHDWEFESIEWEDE